MNNVGKLKKEISTLRETLAKQAAEIAQLKRDAHRANKLVDSNRDLLLQVAVETAHAHEKVNTLLYQNPELVADIARLEEIIGPPTATPKAPPFS